MMTHLPPSLSCSECDKKFVYASNLNIHKKRHQGILNKICKLCNKGYSTIGSLSNHIIENHFAKFHCEVPGCTTYTSSKKSYEKHLKRIHKKDDPVLIKKLIKNLEKLKPDFQQFKYVSK